MQLHELQPIHKNPSSKRIGRGGKRGKTSGRGHKGQLSRAGNSTRPEIRDTIKKIPKLRGHGVNRSRTVNSERNLPVVVNLVKISNLYEDGDTVSPASLVSKGVIEIKGKKLPKVKILGLGDISVKISVQNCYLSESAKKKIELAGGKIV